MLQQLSTSSSVCKIPVILLIIFEGFFCCSFVFFVVGFVFFFLHFCIRTMSPHLRNLYTKSLQAPSIAHVDAFLILSAQKASQLPREHFQQYLLEVFTELQAKKKSLIRICSEWDD